MFYCHAHGKDGGQLLYMTSKPIPEPLRHNYPRVGIASSPTLFEASKLALFEADPPNFTDNCVRWILKTLETRN